MINEFISSLIHRSEKDASGWSKEKLKSLLVGLTFDGPEGIYHRYKHIHHQKKFNVHHL